MKKNLSKFFSYFVLFFIGLQANATTTTLLESIPANMDDLSVSSDAIVVNPIGFAALYSATEMNGKDFAQLNLINGNYSPPADLRTAISDLKKTRNIASIPPESKTRLETYVTEQINLYDKSTHYLIKVNMNALNPTSKASIYSTKYGLFTYDPICRGQVNRTPTQDLISPPNGVMKLACVRAINIDGMETEFEIPADAYNQINSNRLNLAGYLLVRKQDPIKWDFKSGRHITNVVAEKFFIGNRKSDVFYIGYKLGEKVVVPDTAKGRRENATNIVRHMDTVEKLTTKSTSKATVEKMQIPGI